MQSSSLFGDSKDYSTKDQTNINNPSILTPFDKSQLNNVKPDYQNININTSVPSQNEHVHTYTNVYIHDDNKIETPMHLKSPDYNIDNEDNESNYSVQSLKSTRFKSDRDEMKKMRDQDI